MASRPTALRELFFDIPQCFKENAVIIVSEIQPWSIPALSFYNLFSVSVIIDRLCGLVVRVSGYRYRGLGFDSRRYQIF